MKSCLVCKKLGCNELINFGHHPICHNFTNNNEIEKKFPLTLGQCEFCGLIQLTNPIPPLKLVPRYKWITYNEPEEHLDHLVNIIKGLSGITKNSSICGLSYKEDSTLERLNKLGFNNTWRMGMAEDLGILNPNSNLESIQKHFRSEIVNSVHKRRGIPDVVIVRHTLEHTHDTLEFMSTLKKLVNPNGYVIFEVPDCRKGFEDLDYTTIWEEHTLYFTENTFKSCLTIGGFTIKLFETYNYPFESILIGITRPNNIENSKISSTKKRDSLKSEKIRARCFARNLVEKKDSINRYLLEHKKRGGIIVMYGTGHAACMYINLFGIKNLIEYTIDDDLNKEGYFMPGSKLPIQTSKSLSFSNVSLCLLGLSSESEKKVMNKLKFFQNSGGIFGSIYPASKYGIKI